MREFLVNLNYKFIPNSGPREQERHTALQTSFHETVMLVVHVFASVLLSFIFNRVRSFISLELEYSAHMHTVWAETGELYHHQAGSFFYN